MKGEKRYWGVYLRTLAAFLAVWLIMAGVLSANNREKTVEKMSYGMEQRHDRIVYNVQAVLAGTLPEEEKTAVILNRLSDGSYYSDGSLAINRVYYNAQPMETQLSIGSIVLLDSTKGAFDHYILFDRVLTDQEQLAMAELIRGSERTLSNFYGDQAAVDWGEWSGMGRYGEVTGIVEGNVIYPQKLIYHYEEESVVLMESDHPMFARADLTTLSFGAAQIDSRLIWGDASPKVLLRLYHRAQEMIDELMEGKSLMSSWSGSLYASDGKAEFLADGIYMANAYAYVPWRAASHGLGATYVLTFLAALLAAVWISHVQIRTLKRERRFTRAVAHDIKTPAAVLRAYAEALHEGTAPERQKEYLESMMEESDRMAVMVNELLALSNMEGSKAQYLEEDVDLARLVRETFERMTVPMNERGLMVKLDLWPISVKGDSARLTQAIDNLAVNVLCHAGAGLVGVRLYQEKGRAVLTVENPCRPIPEDALKHLWEPFYKVDESRSGSGSGLGLAVVKNVVTLHGGTCSARTTSNRIEFRIELPVETG